MFELRPDGKTPQISLSSFESSNVLNVLRFRLRCRQENKTGVVMLPFGQAFYLDAQGNYLDGRIPPVEQELAQLLRELNAMAIDDMSGACTATAKGETNGTL